MEFGEQVGAGSARQKGQLSAGLEGLRGTWGVAGGRCTPVSRRGLWSQPALLSPDDGINTLGLPAALESTFFIYGRVQSPPAHGCLKSKE